ncbi:outer membrane beta-barrel protein [Fangia hongkongensis]|uniref:outer membrane beta-barrel protein n=1 Tax=Fangia hongkongensis TaxID=270495 RepID=UPI0003641759|nr:outer membrane beta-barrel protein [Fangia hongkongensis]MBK2126317.1 porin family protein [Fangia hongkongensis]
MKLVKKTMIAAVVASTLIAGSAFAAGAQTGLVLGGNLGYGYAQNGTIKNGPAGPLGGAFDKSNGGLAGGVFIGYDYAISKMISVGVEADLQYAHNLANGKVALPGNSSASYRTNGLAVPVFFTTKFYVPGVNGLNVFGKFGYAYNRITTSSSVSIPNLPAQWGGGDHKVTETTNLWRPVIAGGIGYQIDKVNLFAQYQYNFLRSGGNNSGYSTFTGGVSYTLPM